MAAVVQCPNPSCNKSARIRDTSWGRAVRALTAGRGSRFRRQGKVRFQPRSRRKIDLRLRKLHIVLTPKVWPLLSKRGKRHRRSPATRFRSKSDAIRSVPASGRELLARCTAPTTRNCTEKSRSRCPKQVRLMVPKRRSSSCAKPRQRRGCADPHIVPIYDAGCDSGQYYIAAAFIEGQTLAEAIDEDQLTFGQVAEIVQDLAEGLA